MKYITEKFMQTCRCRSVGECEHNSFAEFRALDALVDAFAASLKLILHRKALAGRHGWDDPKWPISEIQCQLGQHIHRAIQRAAEGDSRPNDLLDVAAFAMFWWNRNQPPTEPEAPRTSA